MYVCVWMYGVCMYTYTSECICMYICTCVYMRVWRVCVYVRVCRICFLLCVYEGMYVCVYIRVYRVCMCDYDSLYACKIHLWVYVCECVYVCAYVCIYFSVYISKHIRWNRCIHAVYVDVRM